MANILNLITINDNSYVIVDANPASGGGTTGANGDVAIYDNGTVAAAFIKTGLSNTSWDQINTLAVSGSVNSGTAGRLSVYAATGNALSDTYVQNSQNMVVAYTASPSRTAGITYNIPNPGNAITSTNFILDQGAQTINGVTTFASSINAGGNTIQNAATPVNPTDVAIKSYVDSIAQGISWKNEVVVATTANITLSGTQTIDGVAVVAGNRVLVKNQTTTTQNGIYIVASGAWSYALDFSTGADAVAAAVFVNLGTSNANTGWVCTSPAPITLGTTAITFVQFSGAGSYTAGNGLTLSGTQFSVNLYSTSGLQFVSGQLAALLANSTLSVSASGLQVATGGITNNEVSSSAAIALSKLASLTASSLLVSNGSGVISASAGTGYAKVAAGVVSYVTQIPLTTDVTGVLPIANGGTNSSTALNGNRIMVSSASAIVEAAALTNGQLLIGSTGAAPVAAALTGTANQVNVANAAGSITLSLPQSIATSSSPTFAGLTDSGLTANGAMYAGAGGLLSSTAALTNGQLLVGSTGVAPVATTLTGTTNQVNVTNAAGSITLSTPQNIHTGATPTFAGETLTGAGAFLDLNDTTAAMDLKYTMATVNTTDATVTTIATVATVSNSVRLVEFKVTGLRTGGTAGSAGDCATFIRTARIKNVAGTVTVNNLQSDYTSQDVFSWHFTATVSGTNVLAQINGASNTNITWKCLITNIS